MTVQPTVGALRKREEREKYKVYPTVWPTEEDIKEAKFQKRQRKMEEEKKAGTYQAKRNKINVAPSVSNSSSSSAPGSTPSGAPSVSSSGSSSSAPGPTPSGAPSVSSSSSSSAPGSTPSVTPSVSNSNSSSTHELSPNQRKYLSEAESKLKDESDHSLISTIRLNLLRRCTSDSVRLDMLAKWDIESRRDPIEFTPVQSHDDGSISQVNDQALPKQWKLKRVPSTTPGSSSYCRNYPRHFGLVSSHLPFTSSTPKSIKNPFVSPSKQVEDFEENYVSW